MKNANYYLELIEDAATTCFMYKDNIKRIWVHGETEYKCTVTMNVHNVSDRYNLKKAIEQININHHKVNIYFNPFKLPKKATNKTMVFDLELLGEDGWSLAQNKDLTDTINNLEHLHVMTGLKLGDTVGKYILNGFRINKRNPYELTYIVIPDYYIGSDEFRASHYDILEHLNKAQRKLLKLRLFD